jgi:heterodisulfide reductase subunit B
MAEYTDVVEVMNEVHKEKGGTYSEDTAAEIVRLAAEFYNRNSEEINAITRRELKRQIEKIYNP